MGASVRIPKHRRPLTLAEQFDAEDHPERICGWPRCGRVVGLFEIHVVMDGVPWHFACWHDSHDPKDHLQMRLL